MNRKMIFYMIGQIISLESALLILPTFVALIYRELAVWGFIITSFLALSIGIVLSTLFKPTDKTIFAKDGFVIVALAWISFSLIGALPFVISGDIPNYVDAVFETVSGFTTTGASVLTNVESLSHAAQFWRSFTHWIGGMGVLVLIMAIVPTESGRSMHMIRAEMPGPVVGKLVPKIKDTAKILYYIYMGITVLEIIVLKIGGMTFFESIIHTFGTAGTGGFSIRGDGIASYNPFLQWAIAIFMLLFGVNFNLYYLLLIKKFKAAFKNFELWCYGAIVLVSVTVITINVTSLYNTFSDALRHSFFQVASILTTTGYATENFIVWPELSKAILFILMFIGGCAGSTAGGLKISRVILLFKTIKANLRKIIHPHTVSKVTLDNATVPSPVLTGVSSYFTLYIIILVAVFFLISVDAFDFETNITAAVSCLNNIGPGFSMVGPNGSYAMYSPFSKIVLTFAMLIGRLEIYPILFFFSPAVWKKNS